MNIQPKRDVLVEGSGGESKALRFDEGKLRYDLVPLTPIRGYAKICTKALVKYPERNWERGMLWSKCLGPLKRHLAEFEAGNDFDFDPNCEGCKAGNCKNHLGKDVKHIDQVIWNAGAISSYYETFPQGDDRPHRYLKTPKIGLDIDEVLADWVGAWIEFHKISRPK